MSKYTTQIRWIVEFNSTEGDPISKRINDSLPKIFDFYYPIWDENYRNKLEKKIIMHYFNKEIGLETVGLWKLYLEERLNEIMPYYVEIYKTTKVEYEWLNNVDLEDNFNENKNGDSKGDSINSSIMKDTTLSELNNKSKNTETNTSNNKNDEVMSNYPQAEIGINDYATEGRKTNSANTGNSSALNESSGGGKTNSDSSNNSNGSSSSEYNEKSNASRINKGLNGSRSRTELNVEYRQSLINIDKMIINELHDLFMKIY